MSGGPPEAPDDAAPKPLEEDSAGRTALEVGVEIDADGRVIFRDLPADLLELVLALDPDAQVACSAPRPISEDDQA